VKNPHVTEYSLRLGDDALILGQRMCEWVADAPFLEEDIALANVALDYFGRARMLLKYAGENLGRSEDELAFLRDGRDFKNMLIVELPRGDFAFSLVRQYFLDEFETLFFAELTQSKDTTLAAVAAKSVKEISYHLRRSRVWIRKLGLGTEESNARAQQAIDELWGYTGEFFQMDTVEDALVIDGVAVNRAPLQKIWTDVVSSHVRESGLVIPNGDWQVAGGRQGVHTEHLGHILSELQFLQRAYPGQSW
jgi:ring-1,2-phenylacetyl-CoA epoxidase subunit PaaC